MSENKASATGVTVVVPTLQRGDFLENCIRDLAAQTHRPLEILVVDQSPTVPDKIRELVAELGDIVSYYSVSFRGLPEARNFGLQMARYDAIVYTDDDVRCEPNLVSEHLAALQTPGVGAVAGGIVEPSRGEDNDRPTGKFHRWKAEPLTGFSAHGIQPADHVKGCNFSVWRAAARAAGGFDQTLNFGAALYEDLDFALRIQEAGYKVIFDGEARLTHLVAPSGGCRVDQVGKYTRSLGHNRAIVITRHLSWFEKPGAYAWLMRRVAAYAYHYKQPAVIKEGWNGLLLGRAAGKKPPVCATFGDDVIREKLGG